MIVRLVGREAKCGGPREALWKMGLKTNLPCHARDSEAKSLNRKLISKGP